MQKKFHSVLLGISVFPALLILPAIADDRIEINSQTVEYTDDFSLSGVVVESDSGAMYIHSEPEATPSDVTFLGSATFSNNAADNAAGAIYNTTGQTVTFGGVAGFTSNTANNGEGGAIRNHGTMTFNDAASFTSNTATLTGGAVSNYDADDGRATIIFNDATTFNLNEAGTNGGALYNAGGVKGVMTLNGAGTFTNNTAGGYGGAIYNAGALTVGAGSSFSGNTAKNGGAIYNLGTLSVGNNVIFDGNTATVAVQEDNTKMGGAIYSEVVGASAKTLQFGDNVIFRNNNAYTGAVYLYGANNATFGNNVKFNNNTATDRAGLVLMAANAEDVNNVTVGNNAEFTGNTVSACGAAIGVGAAGDTLTIGENATVSNNKGNAVYNVGTITFGAGAQFAGNETKIGYPGGGAIANIGTLTLNGAIFSANKAFDQGGAIYNQGSITLRGTNTFTGNTANGAANDIYNSGTINIATGTTAINGGITGNGTLNIANGATLNIGNASLTQGTVNLGGIIIALLNNEDDFARFNVDTFNGNGTLTLTMKTAGTYNLFGTKAAVAARQVEFSDAGITVDSPIYNILWSEDGKSVIATRKTIAEVAATNGLSDDAATMVSGLMDSANTDLNDLGLLVQEQLAAGNADAVEHVHAAITPGKESVAQSISASMQNTVANLAMGRMLVPRVGRSGGDVVLTSGGIWAQGIYNKSKQNDAFRGYSRGLAFGIDGTVNNKWTLGAGYAWSHSDIFAIARNTDIDSLTVFVYGQYKPADWYVNAVANYTMSDYSESGTALGMPVTSSYDVNSFGGQIATGYNFSGGITPQFGLRYAHIAIDDYKNSLGIANSLSDTDYLTAVLETRYVHGFDISKNFVLVPDVHYGVKYDMLSDRQTINVTMPGAAAYTLSGERLSPIGAEFGAGLSMKYKDMDLSLNYDIEVREDYTSQTGRVKFRYSF